MDNSTGLKAGAVLASLLLAGAANAFPSYSVSSTPTVNCGSSPHGLWTNTYSSSQCGQFFDFQEGSVLSLNGDTATLQATAKNQAGELATIGILFGGFEETYTHYKNGGTPDYNGTDNVLDWDFYSYIISGTISFGSGDTFNTLLVGQAAPGVASAGLPVLQIGDGANDKSGGFGASAWLDIYGQGVAYTGGSHWDLNMNLSAMPVPDVRVPAPATVILLALGLAGIGWARRRRT